MTETPERPDGLRCVSCHHPVLLEQFNALVGSCARCGYREFEVMRDGVYGLTLDLFRCRHIVKPMEFITFEESAEARFIQMVARLGGYHEVKKHRWKRYQLVADAREIYAQ